MNTKFIEFKTEKDYEEFKKREPNSKPRKYHTPQGYNKFIEYIEELRRNEYFKKDFEKIIKLFWDGVDIKRREKEIFKFITKYNIHWGTFEGLGYIRDKEKFDWGWMFPNIYNDDMCLIDDSYASIYGSKKTKKKPYKVVDFFYESFNTTKNKKLIDKSFIQLYPAVLKIHKFASKRDILDFVEQEWPKIKKILLNYKDRNYRPRKRKLDWRIIDFIWDNRHLPAKEIKENLETKFPDSKRLMPFEISKIISLEKKKRNRKIV